MDMVCLSICLSSRQAGNGSARELQTQTPTNWDGHLLPGNRDSRRALWLLLLLIVAAVVVVIYGSFALRLQQRNWLKNK